MKVLINNRCNVWNSFLHLPDKKVFNVSLHDLPDLAPHHVRHPGRNEVRQLAQRAEASEVNINVAEPEIIIRQPGSPGDRDLKSEVDTHILHPGVDVWIHVHVPDSRGAFEGGP